MQTQAAVKKYCTKLLFVSQQLNFVVIVAKTVFNEIVKRLYINKELNRVYQSYLFIMCTFEFSERF